MPKRTLEVGGRRTRRSKGLQEKMSTLTKFFSGKVVDADVALGD
jgi:hypothetical protein